MLRIITYNVTSDNVLKYFHMLGGERLEYSTNFKDSKKVKVK